MYIKEIILDGFKSYSTRTSITGFDQQFNAITGLNGSGKSNILDAICFVMGISTLKHIRVEKKQELIYKGGTAGVQRASVTLVFDNTNKAQSPPGYEDSDVINVNQTIQDTQSKYFINGRKETMEKIKNLFCSVKLNVNNPHFLIMQGRITKVINMKPVELLGLIEEAAGTSLYQHKREQAQNHIRKKELKQQEIDNILNSEVTPKLDQLKKDKNALDEYKSNVSQLERNEKTLIAFRYYDLSKLTEDPQGRRKALSEKESQLQSKIQTCQRTSDKLREEQKKLDSKNQSDDTASKQLQEEIRKCETEKFRIEKEIESRQSEEQNSKQFQKEQEIRKVQIISRNELLGRLTQDLQSDSLPSCDQELKNKKEQLRDAEDQYKKLQSGEQNDGKEFVESMFKACESQINSLNTKKLQIDQEIKRNHRLKQVANEDLQRYKNEALTFQSDQEKIENMIKDLNQKIDALPNNEHLHDDLKSQAAKLNQSIAAKMHDLDQLGFIKQQVHFEYHIPPNVPDAKNFPGNQVFGRVARLFRVKDLKNYELAISTIIGAKLRNVVVANHTVSRDLLQYKATRDLVSYMPLNKLQFRIVDDQSVKKMKELTGGKVELALNLLDFDDKFKPAMANIFGQTFVAQDSQTAKLVAMENRFQRFNCVTVLGDSYRNDGVLSGGASKFAPILGKIQQYQKIENEVIQEKNQLESLQQRLQSTVSGQTQRRQLESELQQNQRRLERFKSSGGEEAQIKCQHEEQKQKQFEEEEVQLQQKLSEIKDKLSEQENELKELKKQIDQQKKGKGGNDALKFCEQRIDKLKQNVQELHKKSIDTRDQVSKHELEMEENLKLVKQIEEKRASESERLENGDAAMAQLKAQMIKTSDQLDQQKTRSRQLSEALQKLNGESQMKDQQIKDISMQLQELHENRDQTLEAIKTMNQQESDAKKQIDELISNQQWIEHEKQYFNMSGHMYDFKNMDMQQLRESVKQLTSEVEEKKKRVNFKVDSMFEDTNAQYENLILKKKTINENKKQVEETIVYLNNKKNEELERTWQIVNKNLSEIFSILLPGAMAKLMLHKPNDGVDQGLELKVGFNNSWKQSLSELSGGQRSLLALSLILALLRYQPAPLYILDEIDSALDLSHTQNIGLMIKKFFKNSQFLIVSLKEGLFQNANVLFKVQFLDNRSQVKRFLINDSNQQMIKENQAPNKQKATGRGRPKKREAAEDDEQDKQI